MIPFLFSILGNWQKYLVMLFAALALCAVCYVKGCSDERVKFEAFRTSVKIQGEEAERKAKETIAKDLKRKQEADRDAEVNRKRIADLSRRLRESRATSGYLPPAAPNSPSPERAAFDRAILERTLRRLDEGVSGLIDEGDKAVSDLNTAKRWANP